MYFAEIITRIAWLRSAFHYAIVAPAAAQTGGGVGAARSGEAACCAACGQVERPSRCAVRV